MVELNIKSQNTFSPGSTQKQLRLVTDNQLEEEDPDIGLGEEDDRPELVEDLRNFEEDHNNHERQPEIGHDIISIEPRNQYNLRSKKAKINLTTLAKLDINLTNLAEVNLIFFASDNKKKEKNLS